MTNNCHFPHMRFETRRFGSFSVYETTIDCFNLWPTRLAINGYFWNFQSIVCFFCSSHYPDHTSTCNNDREQYNIPFHLCAEVIEEQDLQNLSTCIMLRSGVFLSILLERAPQNLHSQLISLHSQSSNFNFQNFYERLNSLRPLSRTISDISILAQAGFYADDTGCLHCFSCGGVVPCANVVGRISLDSALEMHISSCKHSQTLGQAKAECEPFVPQTVRNAGMCHLCSQHQANVLFRPCNHLVICRSCAEHLYRCPICHQEIIQKIEVFIS